MSRNRHEEDEASEIRLETLNLRESPASCNYHVCQPARALSPDSPFYYPCVPHSRLPLSPPSPSPPSPPSRRFHLSFHPAPSSHRMRDPLALSSVLSHPSIRPTARLAALPTPAPWYAPSATPDRVPTKLLATPDDSGSGNGDSSKRRTSARYERFSPRADAIDARFADEVCKVEPKDLVVGEIDRWFRGSFQRSSRADCLPAHAIYQERWPTFLDWFETVIFEIGTPLRFSSWQPVTISSRIWRGEDFVELPLHSLAIFCEKFLT